MILVSPSIKICDFFFHCWRVGAMSEKRKKKKKKRDTARTLESGESYRFRCPTCVGHRYVAKNGVSVQPSCKPIPTSSTLWNTVKEFIARIVIKRTHLSNTNQFSPKVSLLSRFLNFFFISINLYLFVLFQWQWQTDQWYPPSQHQILRFHSGNWQSQLPVSIEASRHGWLARSR